MTPRPWNGFWRSLVQALQGKPSPFAVEGSVSSAWQSAARIRRRVFLALTSSSTILATLWFIHAQPATHHGLLQGLEIAVFALLSFWVGAGFVTALLGFMVQVQSDPHALSLRAARLHTLGDEARTAIIMPICNEQVSTVFAGLRATCESLAETGLSSLFDLFVLSDTNDPALRMQELAAWSRLRDEMAPWSKIYYRWRQRRTRRKAGNVADFCRRWGKDYRYMVVLDADSVMSGEALVTLVQLMETHPKAGIIQTAPRACGVDTLHARSQQFAGRITGRLFTLGMQYWQLGESHYWGHNAIIRVAPFMQHCALALLPGKGGLSGEILSHDFVEAALMRRAGFFTWLVPDLKGSYEQQPANLLEELQRDRRWCQGNLKNARLILEPGLAPIHRAMLATGVMAYVSAPLWMLFLVLSMSLHLLDATATSASPMARSTLGAMQPWGLLWPATLLLLFAPRVLAVIGVLLRHEQNSYGGTAHLLASALLESFLSVLQAPVRMVAHTVFVVVALTGLKLDWKSPAREAQRLEWKVALRHHAGITTITLGLVALLGVLHTQALWWLLPVALPLLLSPILSVISSRKTSELPPVLGRLLCLPEERRPPSVLRQAWHYSGQSAIPPRLVAGGVVV